MRHFEVCVAFCIHSRTSSACALFQHYLIVACAQVPYVVLAPTEFIIGFIVLDLLEMNFWSMSELMGVLKMLDSCNHLRTKFQ